jgi:Holliday junction resolvase RusA-like endonuclease
MLHPKSHLKANGEEKASTPFFHCVKPDLDKLIRAVLDALTDAKVISDDAHICTIHALKDYGQKEGVFVCLDELAV